jgi:Flp pilus assembly protein TadD
LGNILNYAADPAGAVIEYSKALQLKPNDPGLLNNLGQTLADLGRLDEALRCLRQAAELAKHDLGYPRPHLLTAKVLLRQGHNPEAIQECREALRLEPNNPEALTLTARVLAADQDPGLRDGSAAVTLAQRAVALVPNQPFVLDVLGMAYAEAGDFSNAQATAFTAIQLAASAGMTNIESWRQRLDLYKKSQPWRESFLSTRTPPIERGKD